MQVISRPGANPTTSSRTNYSVLVILPTYNEADTLADLCRAILTLDISDLHILVVDDNSPDGTGKIADDLAYEYAGKVEVIHREQKQGLGTAYTSGFAFALQRDFEYVVEMDADFSHDPHTLIKLLEIARTCDLVIGSRYIRGGKTQGWSLSRLLLSRFANLYVNLLLGFAVRDFTSGFVCYRRVVLEAIDFRKSFASGYAFQIQMKYRALRKGFSLKEIPIVFRERAHGTSKMGEGIIGEAIMSVIKLKFERS